MPFSVAWSKMWHDDGSIVAALVNCNSSCLSVRACVSSSSSLVATWPDDVSPSVLPDAVAVVLILMHAQRSGAVDTMPGGSILTVSPPTNNRPLQHVVKSKSATLGRHCQCALTLPLDIAIGTAVGGELLQHNVYQRQPHLRPFTLHKQNNKHVGQKMNG